MGDEVAQSGKDRYAEPTEVKGDTYCLPGIVAYLQEQMLIKQKEKMQRLVETSELNERIKYFEKKVSEEMAISRELRKRLADLNSSKATPSNDVLGSGQIQFDHLAPTTSSVSSKLDVISSRFKATTDSLCRAFRNFTENFEQSCSLASTTIFLEIENTVRKVGAINEKETISSVQSLENDTKETTKVEFNEISPTKNKCHGLAASLDGPSDQKQQGSILMSRRGQRIKGSKTDPELLRQLRDLDNASSWSGDTPLSEIKADELVYRGVTAALPTGSELSPFERQGKRDSLTIMKKAKESKLSKLACAFSVDDEDDEYETFSKLAKKEQKKTVTYDSKCFSASEEPHNRQASKPEHTGGGKSDGHPYCSEENDDDDPMLSYGRRPRSKSFYKPNTSYDEPEMLLEISPLGDAKAATFTSDSKLLFLSSDQCCAFSWEITDDSSDVVLTDVIRCNEDPTCVTSCQQSGLVFIGMSDGGILATKQGSRDSFLYKNDQIPVSRLCPKAHRGSPVTFLSASFGKLASFSSSERYVRVWDVDSDLSMKLVTTVQTEPTSGEFLLSSILDSGLSLALVTSEKFSFWTCTGESSSDLIFECSFRSLVGSSVKCATFSNPKGELFCALNNGDVHVLEIENTKLIPKTTFQFISPALQIFACGQSGGVGIVVLKDGHAMTLEENSRIICPQGWAKGRLVSLNPSLSIASLPEADGRITFYSIRR